ncbi:Tetratricopeptide repeat-containing protein [Catalinimonas alkaloidigena]|uniref:Tetratricopeptide repeat-containing protein n=1 Tax=Catalinimonas alkaloidigena TaxID=1075417 RepID=A0A1G9KJ62_9BACT|nr:tetratricopeptide repeat protein [Catalinimonas alkaloidigena]SDL49751.1 Tetratricopeptide repeat-containing protein [Catalinimonas alkaloidigena]
MDPFLFERIDAYLLETMSPEERQRFEDEVRTQPELAEEVALQRKLIQGIETESVRRLLQELHTRQTAAPVMKASPARRTWLTLTAIAASVLLILIGRWAFVQYASPSSADLYAAYYSPAPGLPTTLGATDNPDFSEGMVAYKLGNYQEARQWWLPLTQQDAANDTLNFYLGVSYLATTQTDSALYYLRRVYDAPKTSYGSSARWYMALGYLQTSEPERARELLQNFREDDPRREEIVKLLNELPKSQ